MGAMTGLSVRAYRAFGHRMRVQGRPLLLLNTVGARSGEPRRTILGWFPDDGPGSYLVTASNAGSASHPAWYLNMACHPDRVTIEIGGRTISVGAESLAGRSERPRGVASSLSHRGTRGTRPPPTVSSRSSA